MAGGIFSVVFPSSCSLCHRELREAGSIDICSECWAGLVPWEGSVCARCGLPMAPEHMNDSSDLTCYRCRQDIFKFDGARSFGVYAGGLRGAILQLKFRRRERLGKRLGKFLAAPWAALPGHNTEPPLLVPVPLHPSRQRQRGFNQAELLARGLWQELKESPGAQTLQLRRDCLHRIRMTAPQTGLSLYQRLENVRGVFSVPHPELVRGRSIIVVDDVMTTGATLSGCAEALKNAGAAQVMGLTLARATPQFPDLDATTSFPTIDDMETAWP